MQVLYLIMPGEEAKSGPEIKRIRGLDERQTDSQRKRPRDPERRERRQHRIWLTA